MTSSAIVELPRPLYCIYCGRVAQWLVDGTSACRDHKARLIALGEVK